MANIVKVLIGKKVWEMSIKQSKAIIEMAKQKYKGKNAIVAVQKGDYITLLKDVFDSSESLEKAIKDWEESGYKCEYIKVKA